MPQFQPANDQYLSLDGTTAYISVADSLTLKGKQTVEATIHLYLNALPGGTYTVFGKSSSADFAFTVSTAGICNFTTRRAGGNATAGTSSAEALVAGKEYILRGTDDGTTVKLYVNGVLASTTATSGSGALVKDTNSYMIAATVTGTNLTSLRVYAAQIIFDGVVVFRFQPHDGAGTTLRDMSQFGQTVTITGTENTNYYWASAWSREPIFPGTVNPA